MNKEICVQPAESDQSDRRPHEDTTNGVFSPAMQGNGAGVKWLARVRVRAKCAAESRSVGGEVPRRAGSPVHRCRQRLQECFYFRKEIVLATMPQHYWVHLSEDNRFELHVNGQYAAEGPARGDLLHWRFETVDLVPTLRSGKNFGGGVELR